MAHPKVKILQKSPNSKNCEDSHKFRINSRYSHPRIRVEVPYFEPVYEGLNNWGLKIERTAQKSEDGEIVVYSIDEKNKRIFPDSELTILRRYQMDAAIVRIMMARRTLTCQVLISEVKKQLRFRFTPLARHIVERIQSLIEREYLERDARDRNTYHYVV